MTRNDDAGRGLSRRALLGGAAAAACLPSGAAPEPQPWFTSRGLVIVPTEAPAMGLPERAVDWGITVLDLGHYVEWAARTDEGQRLIDACRQAGVGFEFSLHICTWFLPRDLFAKNPTFFRMNDAGERVPDANLCIHSRAAVDLLCENAAKFADILRPSTSRYHYWIDDGQPMCRCPKCRELSDSEQALILEHALLKALRRGDPNAKVSHLAYQVTSEAPRQLKPKPGIFLEYAPFQRDTLKPLSDPHPAHRKALQVLDDNLRVFGSAEAEVLEYWLDNSRYSEWNREKIRQIPWNQDAFAADVAEYARRGIRRMRTYCFWFDDDYVKRYGMPPIDRYIAGLARWRCEKRRAVERP